MYEGKINKLEFGSHQKLLRLVGKNKNVLEVGCARGAVSEKLRENGCKVTAVEINREMAAEARPKCDQIIRANFESDNLGLKPESFDIVLFADVLEHMGNPGKALQKARGLLKKEGRVVASIPIRANLCMISTSLTLKLKGGGQAPPVG